MTLPAIGDAVLLFLALALLSAGVVRLMIRLGRVDIPVARSSHTTPTPKGGGLGILAAVVVGVLVLLRHGSRTPDESFIALAVSASTVAVMAFLDDYLNWRARNKLAIQVLAVCVSTYYGYVITSINMPIFGALSLGFVGPLLTIVWVIFTTNALNFMDGLNGLAAGVIAIASASCLWFFSMEPNDYYFFVCLALLAGISGFIPFNFPNARIFMGDVGSQFCGFLIAELAVTASQVSGGEFPIALVPMCVFGLVFDVGYTLCRRFMAGERLSEPHRTHLYQLAHRSGMPASWVAVLEWCFAAWGCALYLLTWHRFFHSGLLMVGLVVAPQLLWLAWVDRITRRAGLPSPRLRWRRRRMIRSQS